MRERRYLTFDIENPRHREAFALFSAQSAKRRSEYVVDCIIKAQDENRLVETMQKIIMEALRGISFSTPAAENKTADLQTTENISELPDALLTSLEEI
jgi:hypothetical protein